MSTEDFENQLRRARMREIPAEWRGKMLAAARTETGGMMDEIKAARAGGWLRNLSASLWPSPLAWGALACVWVGIWISTLGGPVRTGMSAATSIANDRERREVWMMRLAAERSLAENRSGL